MWAYNAFCFTSLLFVFTTEGRVDVDISLVSFLLIIHPHTVIIYFTVVISAFQSTSNYLVSWDPCSMMTQLLPRTLKSVDSRLWWLECAWTGVPVFMFYTVGVTRVTLRPHHQSQLSPGGESRRGTDRTRWGNGRWRCQNSRRYQGFNLIRVWKHLHCN